MTAATEEKLSFTKEEFNRALAEVHAAADAYAREFVRRMLAGEEPNEWDYMAAMMASDIAIELADFLKVKK